MEKPNLLARALNNADNNPPIDRDYNLSPKELRELTNSFAHNDTADFLEYAQNQRDHFVKFFLSTNPKSEFRVQVENLLIAYDQLTERVKEK